MKILISSCLFVCLFLSASGQPSPAKPMPMEGGLPNVLKVPLADGAAYYQLVAVQPNGTNAATSVAATEVQAPAASAPRPPEPGDPRLQAAAGRDVPRSAAVKRARAPRQFQKVCPECGSVCTSTNLVWNGSHAEGDHTVKDGSVIFHCSHVESPGTGIWVECGEDFSEEIHRALRKSPPMVELPPGSKQ